MSAQSPDSDGPIHVSVVPSQASYFAGEPFSVTITFTNTRSSTQPTTVRSASHGSHHKRSAHSISSVPIARPPTSPATPRTISSTSFPRLDDEIPIRRGLIGLTGRNLDRGSRHSLSEPKRRTTGKAASTSFTPQDLHEIHDLADAPMGIISQTTESGLKQSALSDGRAAQIASHHPHARKQSVVESSFHITNMNSNLLVGSSTAVSAATSASSLDIISENGSTSPTEAGTSSISSVAPTAVTPSRGLSQSVLGRGHCPSATPPSRGHVPSSLGQPGAELLLYSYVQLIGSVHIADLSTSTPLHSSTVYLNALRGRLAKRRIVGGGSMDITSSLRSPPPIPKRRARSLSISSGILSLLSPLSAGAPSSPSWASSRFVSPSLQDLSSAQESVYAEVDPETPLPTFEVQPAMLVVDLSLRPGEVRTYKYTVNLPDNLPPTFKGRALKFSYDLLVGTCRALSTTPQSGTNAIVRTSASSSSRVMRVPIRVYPHVSVDHPPKPYDLLWPLARRKEANSEAQVVEQHRIHETRANSLNLNSVRVRTSSLDDVRAYARQLLHITPEIRPTSLRVKLPPDLSMPNSPAEDGEDLATPSCREAVEILTRNPKKVSYDVTKDTMKVAVLTFTKSAYRLGETVLGVLALNERDSRARVLKVSAVLETRESLPDSITPPSLNARQMRKVHGEHHSSYLTSTRRTTFTLDIPADGTPAFGVDIGGVDTFHGTGGLEWKVRICLLVGIASEEAQAFNNGCRLKHLVRDGERGEWGSSWKAASTLAPMQHFNNTPGPGDASLGKQPSWTSFFASPFLGSATETAYHDGDEALDDVAEVDDNEADIGGGDEGWQDLKLEMVECEVPITVWPGNTAFKATEVVFDV